MYALALALVCQCIEPVPAMGEVDAPVEVRAWSAEQEPLVGLPVTVREPDGDVVPVGTTDDQGVVAFTPAMTGDHELRAELPGESVVLLAPFRAVAPARRWLWFLLVPVGAALLWWNLRRWRD